MQLYAAPVPYGTRSLSSSPLGPNSSSSPTPYGLAAPDSPSFNKEGFDLSSAEKYETQARAGYARDRGNSAGGVGGKGGLGGLWMRRKKWIVGGGLLALAVIVGVAVGVPMGFVPSG